MAGFDFLLGGTTDQDQASRAGLLAAGLGILANNNQRNAGPAIGAGGLAGMQAYRGTLDQQQQDEYKKLQMAQLRQAMAQKQAQMDWLNGGGAAPAAAAPVSPSALPTFQLPGTFGMNGYGAAPQAASAPQQGGLLQRTPEDFARAAVLGVPGIDKAWDIYKANKEGVKRDPGATYRDLSTGQETYVPKLDNNLTINNGVVSALPGSVQATGQLAGATAQAQEAAKAGYDLVAVPDGQGGTVMMPRAQAAQYLRQMSGMGGAPSPAGGGFGTTQSPVVQGAATAVNDNFLKHSYQPVIDAGRAAGDMTASITALRSIPLETGWGTEAKATAAGVLTSLGIAPKSAEVLAGNAQKFQSVAMDRLLTTLKAQAGPQTEGDATRATQTFAKLSNTPEANAFIMDFAQAKANREQRKAAFYESALPLAQKSGDLQRIDREWRKIQGSIWSDPILQKWGAK
ncbi:hypothetical protein [Cupriavidus necator]|uniref:hypothetical protein n=1 Tax=Cupriavidus necator TaxID=106590 RepID=UPI00339D6A68